MTSRVSTTIPDFQTVFDRLKPHMRALDQYMGEQLAGFEPEIREMAAYCIDTSGKRIRPALVFICGETNGRVSQPLIQAAAVVELVHLATLVHDDIMDGASVRRGRHTAGREYGSEAAVLLGDALFAHALHLAATFPTTEVCRVVADSTRKVCAGEIVQTMRRGTVNVTREDYFRVIDLKTAELFRTSCLLGTRLSGYDDKTVAAVSEFGRKLGIAYQIYDDLADFYGEEKRIGKTLGTDLASGKLTLPLMTLREQLPASEARQLDLELTGQSKPDIVARLAQMETYDVFRQVADVVEAELKGAEALLAEFANLELVPALLQLTEVVRLQLRRLR